MKPGAASPATGSLAAQFFFLWPEAFAIPGE